MIPVSLQVEPADFDSKVRQPGIKWFKDQKLDITKALPTGVEPKGFWQGWGLQQLHSSYNGICAYLAIYICSVTGQKTVDHYKGKKKYPHLAYEWTNYRLACGAVNTNKGESEAILDPFLLRVNRFRLSLLTGEIFPLLPPDIQAMLTIQVLKLNSETFKKVRREYYLQYREGDISDNYLRRRAPFVFQEVTRQRKLHEKLSF